MFCKHCGKEIDGNSKFCANCGGELEKDLKIEKQPIPNSQALPIGVQKPKKKTHGCLITVIIFLVFTLIIGIAVSQNAGSSKKTDPAAEKKERLAFDDRSWKDYSTLYESYLGFNSLIDNYSNGKISKLDFYNACKEAEDIFAKNSLIFNYGETDTEKDYLSTFTNLSLAQQMAAKSYKKYIDSGSMEDLSDAQNYLKTVDDTFTTILASRSSVLKKAGLTDAEIDKKLDKGIADLRAKKK